MRLGFMQRSVARESLSALLKKPVELVKEPQHAVAHGLAMLIPYAVATSGIGTAKFLPSATTAATMQDRTSSAVSVGVSDAASPARPVCSCLAPVGSAVPSTNLATFRLLDPKQDSVILRFFQGREGQPVDEATKLGEVVLDKLPLEAVRTPRVQVETVINKNHLAEITVTDLVSKRQKKVSLKF
jgi:molecular chaperone DnaK (HSP70)